MLITCIRDVLNSAVPIVPTVRGIPKHWCKPMLLHVVSTGEIPIGWCVAPCLYRIGRIIVWYTIYHQFMKQSTKICQPIDGVKMANCYMYLAHVQLQLMPNIRVTSVNRLDQNTRQNKEKKALRWYWRIEVKLREFSLHNAYVLEGTVVNHRPPSRRARDQLSFRMDISHQLSGKFWQARQAYNRPRSIIEDARLDEKVHWPVSSSSSNRVCVACNRKHKAYLSSHPGISVKENPYKCTKTRCVKNARNHSVVTLEAHFSRIIIQRYIIGNNLPVQVSIDVHITDSLLMPTIEHAGVNRLSYAKR